MTREEVIDICLEALKAHEDGSDAWFDVMRDVAGLKVSKNPCEDTVNRKAVLNLAKDLTFDGVEGMEHYKHRCIEIEDVEELPPATPDLSSLREINEALTKRVKYLENMERYAMPAKPTQTWTPVTEGLPEEETDVLICNSKGDIEVSRGSAFDDGTWEWYTSGWHFGEVLAWASLPKPYEGGNK